MRADSPRYLLGATAYPDEKQRHLKGNGERSLPRGVQVGVEPGHLLIARVLPHRVRLSATFRDEGSPSILRIVLREVDGLVVSLGRRVFPAKDEGHNMLSGVAATVRCEPRDALGLACPSAP